MSDEFKVGPTSRRLGEYVECGAVAVEAALAMQAQADGEEPPRRLGELLLEIGAIDLEELLRAVQLQRVDRLAACPLFAALSRSELQDLSAVFQEVTVEPAEQFITQDDKDPCLYVVASGTLKVYRVDETGEEIPLARVFPGEPVGEMGYFADGVRSASVRGLERCQLLRASYDDLTDCFESVPAVASAFMDVVTHRLRKTNVLYQENRLAHERAAGTLSHLGGYLAPGEIDDLESRVDQLLERLVHTASWLTDSDRASLFLIDDDGDELWSKVAQGEHMAEIRVPLGSGVVGWTISNNQIANVEDAYEDSRFNREVDRHTGYRTSTILCTPVRDDNRRVLGALQIINKSIGVFTEEDESLARAVASQAALGIENINVFRTVLESHRRATDVLEIATACSEAADRLALGAAVAEIVAGSLRSEQARLYYVDAVEDTLWCAASGGEGTGRATVAMDDSLAGHALTTGELVNVRDAFEDARYDRRWDRDRSHRVRNALCAPVRDRAGRLVGVLEAVNRLDGVFDENDEALAQALAAQLGVARLLAEGSS